MEKKKILVVDDEQDFLDVVQIRLEANNYEVFTASNGEEALEKIKDIKPAAVLLDILMPGMNGLEVLKKIRKFDKHLPVYMITAFSTDDRFRDANRLGASGFIVKTEDLAKEIDDITSALDMSGRLRRKK